MDVGKTVTIAVFVVFLLLLAGVYFHILPTVNLFG